MGRQRRGFDWSADPDDPELREPAPRESRAPLKQQLDEVHAFVLDLIAHPPAERRRLPLDAGVLAEIDALARLPPSPARKRQLSYVKRLLAREDLEVLRRASRQESAEELRARRADRWRRRLLEEGDEALQALVEACPTVDRQQVRALIRRAPTSERALRALFDFLVSALAADAGE